MSKPRYGGERRLRVSTLANGLAKTCRKFETVEAWRQKELAPVCTENPVTIQHVKVDY